ncbi:MAG TPA: helix-turn-helix domain-containing protein [Candidatus Nanoarchaeia archaeon]|nr:helix-turn-helix domain-containing protein [Candidatus Nanoarchaeia archaeon]
MKQGVLDRINVFLLKKGFTIKNFTRSCFDVLARKEEQILLIKVLEDANSITREYAEEMNAVASYCGASPLVIAEKAGLKLEDNVVYARFDIHTLNINTIFSCINNKLPFIRRSHAGLTASVVGSKLKEKREELGYSLNALSKKIGVTSRMIMKYENENSEVTINKALKIYDIFGYQVFNKIDIFSSPSIQKTKLETEVSKKYVELGFDASETKKTPFDIIAKKGKEIILTEMGENANPQMESLSKLLDADNLVIFKKKKPKNIPSMTQKEFMDFQKSNELVKFLKDF